MKLLDGKTPLIGQPVVTLAADGYAVAGQIQMLNERNGTVRITGYALAVPADKVVLAADAYAAFVAPIAAAEAKAAEDAAKAEADKLAADGVAAAGSGAA